MKVPVKWLKEYMDIDISVEELSESLTLSGSIVENVEVLGEGIKNVFVGKIGDIKKHPNADKLLMASVDMGDRIVQVLTAAENIKVGDYIPVALNGAVLHGGQKIKKGKIRGEMSEGMMCSIGELGLDRHDYPDADEDGIFILNDQQDISEYVLGQDIKEIIGYDDEVLEFEITSNRPDCLSIEGIAREASATLSLPKKKIEINVEEKGEPASDYIAVEIEDPDLCSRYGARIVKNVVIKPSPDWLRKRLRACGVRPINNIVDITNYVMIELGQPMHAFDLNYIRGSRIIVRRAKDGEKMTTLDGKERILDPSILVIADGERAVALAGIMGGENSEVMEDTKTVLLESATFNGIGVRLAAKKLGLRTEASGRFEKGLDPENAERAINRAAQLIEMTGSGEVLKGVVDCYPAVRSKRVLKLEPEKINAFLGTSIETDFMMDALESLDFKVDRGKMEVSVPTFRDDVESRADLSEEVARLYGYNNIKATLLKGKTQTVGRRTREQKIEGMVQRVMVACGLSEIYTYSFTSPKIFDRLRLDSDDPLRKAITISNPLGEDYSIMRTTTIGDMLITMGRNFSRKNDRGAFFELSHIYIPREYPLTGLPDEKQVLTLGKYNGTDFYDLKGILEELFSVLRISHYEFIPERDNRIFHPGRCARILIGNNDAGIIGQIHPETAENFSCAPMTVVAVMDMEALVDSAAMESVYRQLPRHPGVERDLAVILKDEIPASHIEREIRDGGGKILESVELFDIYKGKQVPQGFKSMAYSIVFRAEDRNLTDEEVNPVMEGIIHKLQEKFQAELR